jgi:hypothetical protein
MSQSGLSGAHFKQTIRSASNPSTNSPAVATTPTSMTTTRVASATATVSSNVSGGEAASKPPSSVPVLLIFVIEATLTMASSYSELLGRYIVPICHQAKHLGQKKTEFALITYGGYPPSSKRTIDKTSFTFDVEYMTKQLSQLECAGSFLEHHALSDALMCVLEVYLFALYDS